ncbi:uncharacterized protein LOC111703848 [Eurytemora carolleeae]|uniref:uncharacterized protein LOC111703848 n=1 Tax=Eurytemora carolleeae TaxID=1294199 RepID=UPI000C78723C|nr:uncharacterized protein LOC111703848 [Eurytemora carolleeae]|eukprot:XP_023331688.1 uncharacterized protein LOC111703848 [Eurytemora affinis]
MAVTGLVSDQDSFNNNHTEASSNTDFSIFTISGSTKDRQETKFIEKSKNAGTKKINFATLKEQQYSASEGEEDINAEEKKEEEREQDDLPITNNPHLPIFMLNTRNSREPNRTSTRPTTPFSSLDQVSEPSLPHSLNHSLPLPGEGGRGSWEWVLFADTILHKSCQVILSVVTCLLLLTGILITTLTITSGTGDLGFGGPLLIGLGLSFLILSVTVYLIVKKTKEATNLENRKRTAAIGRHNEAFFSDILEARRLSSPSQSQRSSISGAPPEPLPRNNRRKSVLLFQAKDEIRKNIGESGLSGRIPDICLIVPTPKLDDHRKHPLQTIDSVSEDYFKDNLGSISDQDSPMRIISKTRRASYHGETINTDDIYQQPTSLPAVYIMDK